MIRNILLGLVGFVILALILVWILNRGPQRLFQQVKNFSLVGTTTGGFALPWQPTNTFPYVDEKDLFGENANMEDGTSVEEEFADIQRKYEEILKNADDVMTYGDPSPQFRAVRIVPTYSNVASGETASEYIVIEAPIGNTAPVSLDGWSLQSALSGARISIPRAASPLTSGVNDVRPASLSAGTYAVLATSVSPVGVSFRENICTGYLAQFQPFEPPLSLQCPSPSSEMPLTAENLKQYGDVCFDFVRSLPTCEFPRQVSSAITPECRSFLQNRLSYGGCVKRHQFEPSFAQDSWRLYLGSATELWRNTHDAIKLLDEEGRTVDVYVY